MSIQIPNVTPSSALPTLSALDKADALINVFRMILRSPEITEAVATLGAAQFAHSSVPPLDRELAILAAGTCYESEYEAAQHGPISRAVGVTDEQRAAIAEHRWDDSVFTAAQQALIQFVITVAKSPTVPHDVMERACRHYSEKQVVELVVQTGFYFMLGRITTVFDIPIDAPSDARVFDTGVGVAGGA